MAVRLQPISSSRRKTQHAQPIHNNLPKFSRSQIRLLTHQSNSIKYEKSILSKSPLFDQPSHYKNHSIQNFPSSTPRIIKKTSSFNRPNKPLKSPINVKFTLKHSKRGENFRYLENPLEESCKNFNAISTPPDEEPKSCSPISDFIDKEFNFYINQWPRYIPKLNLGENSLVTTKSKFEQNKSVPKKRLKSKFSFKSVKKLEKKISAPNSAQVGPSPNSIRWGKRQIIS